MVSVAREQVPLRSHLLVGSVGHRRLRIRDYAFTHSVWYAAVDLDELEEVDARSRLLAVDGRGLLQLLTRDHIVGPEGDSDGLGRDPDRDWSRTLDGEVRRHLDEGGFDAEGWRITLIAYPRVLGTVFNPVSFYLCHDSAGVLRHAIAEVHNTHGEREVYDFTPEDLKARVFTSTARKRFYVSPFIGPDAEYRIRIVEDGDQLAIALYETEAGEAALDAAVRLRRIPLTDTNLARLSARDPLMGLKTIGLIAWHAARLWVRLVPWDRFRPKAEYGRRVK